MVAYQPSTALQYEGLAEGCGFEPRVDLIFWVWFIDAGLDLPDLDTGHSRGERPKSSRGRRPLSNSRELS